MRRKLTRASVLGVLQAILASVGFAQEPLPLGEPIEGEITDSDKVVSTAKLEASSPSAPAVGRSFSLVAPEAGAYTIELRSWHFDTYLVLRGAEGEVLAEDDDGLLSTHSRIETPELEGGVRYLLEACALHGARGPFELVVRRGSPPVLSLHERAAAQIADLERRVAVTAEVEGPKSVALGDALYGLGLALYRQGRYAEARAPWERSLAIREEALGLEHLDTLASLNGIGVLLRLDGDLQTAQVSYERALESSMQLLGPEHYETASVLNNLADVLREQGEYRAAWPYYERALAITERVQGPEHPDTGLMLSNLGLLAWNAGELDSARDYLERALAILEKGLGPEHPNVAISLGNLGAVLESQGDYDSARSLQERALAIRERALGPEHPSLANNLNNLGSVLVKQGELEAGQRYHQRAHDIWEETYGPQHPSIATSLDNLGLLLRAQGDLVGARVHHERALAIREEALGSDHPATCRSLLNLGVLFDLLGDREAAQDCLERALTIREEVLGPEHPDTAVILGSLAWVLTGKGEPGAAWALYERALAIWEESVGLEHSDAATTLMNLGVLLRRQGELEEARSCYERALGIMERVHGPRHRRTANALRNLGILTKYQGDLVAAREFLERSVAIHREASLPTHPDALLATGSLAVTLTQAGERERARELLLASSADLRTHLEGTMIGLTEAESFRFLAEQRWMLELRLSLFASEDPELLAEAYEMVLEWKGQIARALVASRDRLARDLSNEQHELVRRIRAKQGQLSWALSQAGDGETQRFEALRQERNRLELELARSLDGSKRAQAVSLDDVRAALPPGAAVLDFFLERVLTPAVRDGDEILQPADWDTYHLVAWIVRPEDPLGGAGEEGRPGLVRVDLGPDIKSATWRYRRELMAGRGEAPSASAASSAANELRRMLWDPLSEHLAGVELLILSPDSFLGILPFETLQLEDGSFLIEELAVVYQPDVSSLVGREGEVTADYGSLLAMGGVDFAGEVGAPASSSERGEPLAASSSSVPSDLAQAWGRLPGTEAEARLVRDLHAEAFADEGPRLLLQANQPSEARLKEELPKHSILHLATHGFFQPKGTLSMWESATNDAGRSERGLSEQASHLVGDHPGLLSGLVCAGASHPGSAGEDGYLTAEEVGWLDLSRAELVVMSACETGLGTARSGEGMLGLQRAFRLAGAKTVISSLWKVEDQATAELMGEFYRNLFLKGLGRHEALRSAQLAMLQRNRTEHGEALPSTWGAFVLSGEWR